MDENSHEKNLMHDGIAITRYEKSTWKPLVLQIIICSAVWCSYFMQGLYIGAPTVIIAQIRREANSTDALTDEMSSWISTMPVMSAMPFIIIVPWVFYKIGRKYTYLSLGVFQLTAFTILYCSKNSYHILISQVFIGICTGATYTCIPILVTEYTSPKYRGIFLTIKSASVFWGVWVSNAIGTFYYWKNIAVVGLVCSSYILITMFVWPDSPYWLAMKGRYADSAKSFRLLRGVDKNSEKELAELICSRNKTKMLPLSTEVNDRRSSRFLRAYATIKLRQFYEPTFISMILFAQIQFSGKFVMSVYALQLLNSISQDESVGYKGMLILDGVTVLSMYGGCILSKYFNRRILMFLFSITAIIFLYIMSVYLYLVNLVVLNENHFIVISLLIVFSIANGCGPLILASSIYGEIIPSCYQNYIMVIVGLFTVVINAVMLKFSPFMFKYLKMHGYFLFLAICSSIVVIILYIFLPETKDKTVHEINTYFSKNQRPIGQNKRLLQTRE